MPNSSDGRCFQEAAIDWLPSFRLPAVPSGAQSCPGEQHAPLHGAALSRNHCHSTCNLCEGLKVWVALHEHVMGISNCCLPLQPLVSALHLAQRIVHIICN